MEAVDNERRPTTSSARGLFESSHCDLLSRRNLKKTSLAWSGCHSLSYLSASSSTNRVVSLAFCCSQFSRTFGSASLTTRSHIRRALPAGQAPPYELSAFAEIAKRRFYPLSRTHSCTWARRVSSCVTRDVYSRYESAWSSSSSSSSSGPPLGNDIAPRRGRR